MKTTSTAKKATKKETNPATTKVESKPKSKKVEHIVGKTTGKTRPQFLVDLIVANVKAKKTDAEMTVIAVKEFGADNIPGTTGLYNIPRWRSGANYFRKSERYGLKKTDPKFVSFGK